MSNLIIYNSTKEFSLHLVLFPRYSQKTKFKTGIIHLHPLAMPGMLTFDCLKNTIVFLREPHARKHS